MLSCPLFLVLSLGMIWSISWPSQLFNLIFDKTIPTRMIPGTSSCGQPVPPDMRNLIFTHIVDKSCTADHCQMTHKNPCFIQNAALECWRTIYFYLWRVFRSSGDLQRAFQLKGALIRVVRRFSAVLGNLSFCIKRKSPKSKSFFWDQSPPLFSSSLPPSLAPNKE